MARVVADLGNSRLKWGLVDDSGRVTEVIALPLNETPAWVAAWRKWCEGGIQLSDWAVSSVNPRDGAWTADVFQGHRRRHGNVVPFGGGRRLAARAGST